DELLIERANDAWIGKSVLFQLLTGPAARHDEVDEKGKVLCLGFPTSFRVIRAPLDRILGRGGGRSDGKERACQNCTSANFKREHRNLLAHTLSLLLAIAGPVGGPFRSFPSAAGLSRACKSAWSPSCCGPVVPARCECQLRDRASGSRSCGE